MISQQIIPQWSTIIQQYSHLTCRGGYEVTLLSRSCWLAVKWLIPLTLHCQKSRSQPGSIFEMLDYFKAKDIKIEVEQQPYRLGVGVVALYCLQHTGTHQCQLPAGQVKHSQSTVYKHDQRMAIHKIHFLPHDSHSHFLHLLCQCSLWLDELWKHFLQFIRAGLFHNPTIVRDVFNYALKFGQTKYCIDSNITFCLEHLGVHADVLLVYSETVYAAVS